LFARHARRAHRERGSLGAGRGPASLEETTALRIPTTPWTLCGFSSCGYQELGAWGPCGWWLRGPPPPRPQRLSSGPAGHNLLPANSRLSPRLLSLSLHATQLAVVAIVSCWDRCLTFWGMGLLVARPRRGSDRTTFCRSGSLPWLAWRPRRPTTHSVACWCWAADQWSGPMCAPSCPSPAASLADGRNQGRG